MEILNGPTFKVHASDYLEKTMRVAVLDDYLKVAESLADWSSLKADVKFFDQFIQPDQLAKTLADFDVVVAMRERSAFPAAVIQAMPKLKLLVTTGLRNNSIDLEACRQKGVVVCGSPGDPKSTGATAELAWALMLALFKKIPQESVNMTNGLWQTSMPPTVEGKRLGLVGAGQLGKKVAKVGQAFGMEVVAWSPNLTEERAAEAGVKLVESVELFSHLANIGDTRSLIIHPASTTHSQLSEGELIEAGAGPDVVRVSVGIEHIDDIIADIAQALDKI